MQTTYIYTLSDPNTKEVRYIGRTIDLTSRYAQHIRAVDGNKKDLWIRSLTQAGLRPKMEVLDEVPLSEWAFWESYWISQLEVWGFNLTNIHKSVVEGVDTNVKPCSKYDLEGNFLTNYGSWAQAGEEVGITASRLCNSVRTQQPVKGFLWDRGEGWEGKQITVNPSVVEAYQLKKHKQEVKKAKPIACYVTQEYREKQREKSIGNLSSICTPIIQYTMEGQIVQEWRSIRLAAINTGNSLYKLKKDLNSNTSKFTGFLWKMA